MTFSEHLAQRVHDLERDLRNARSEVRHLRDSRDLWKRRYQWAALAARPGQCGEQVRPATREAGGVIDPTENAAVVPTACPDCGDAAHPSDTVCAACGAHLSPATRNTTAGSRAHLGDGGETQQKEAIVPDESECVCGTCARCALASYEPDIAVLNAVHDTLEAAIARPGNVAELRRWSVKA